MKRKKENKLLVQIAIALGILGLISLVAYTLKAINPKISMDDPINDDGVVRLLAVGSSSTAAEYSYIDQLVELYPEIYKYKIAQVGATTGWMLENAEPELLSDVVYDAVIIFGGLNDIYATLSIDAAKQNIQSMVELANQRGSISVVLTLQPTHNYDAYTTQKGDLTNQLNEWIKKSCPCDYVIDVYALLSVSGVQNEDYFQPDMLHLNYDAHSLVAAEIDNSIFI